MGDAADASSQQGCLLEDVSTMVTTVKTCISVEGTVCLQEELEMQEGPWFQRSEHEKLRSILQPRLKYLELWRELCASNARDARHCL